MENGGIVNKVDYRNLHLSLNTLSTINLHVYFLAWYISNRYDGKGHEEAFLCRSRILQVQSYVSGKPFFVRNPPRVHLIHFVHIESTQLCITLSRRLLIQLSQRDITDMCGGLETEDRAFGGRARKNSLSSRACEVENTFDWYTIDFTPAEYITLLFTDLGAMTPAAVSDELIKLYQ
jgi:hypothetical protein